MLGKRRHLCATTMHCGTAVAGRTRSRQALIEKLNLQNVKQSKWNNRVKGRGGGAHSGYAEVVGLSSDEEEDIGDEVLSEAQQESETSGSGSKCLHFDAGSHGSEESEGEDAGDDVVSDDSDGDFLFEVMNEVENFEDYGNLETSEAKSTGETNKGEFGVRRRKSYGLDILIDENASQHHRCVAQRTRSHFGSIRRNKKLKLGTFSQPICLDEEEQEDESLSDSDSEEGDLDDEEGRARVYDISWKTKTKFFNCNGEEESGSDEEKCSGHKREGFACVKEVHKKGKLEKLTRKKHILDPKDFDAVKILQDSIYGKGELPLEARDEEPNPNMDLPLKFTFLTEVPKPPEKSEYEKGLDAIWVEMAYGLNASQHDSGPASQVSSLEEVSGSDEEKSSLQEKPEKVTREKHIHDPNDFDVVKILQDSVCGKGEEPLEAREEEEREEEGNPNVDLPLKFTFLTEEPKPPEKSEYEKELDALWVEMACGLDASQHNSDPASQVQSNTDSDHDQYPMDEVKTATLCHQGKHHFILDEEIGLRCAYCLHVGLEIKYFVPPFSENPWGKSNRRDSFTVDHVDHSVFNELQHRITGYDDYNLYNYTGTVWDIIPGVRKSMYPHQCEAFEFLWSNLAGGIFLDNLKEQKDFRGGGGCIISHAPGTGKTRLTIVFLQTYMELYPTCRPIIIAPKGMLLTWEEEFKTWKVDIPFHNLNNSDYSGKESEVAMSLVRNSGRYVSSRVVKLYSWKCNKSILGISYKLFEQLAGQSPDDKDLRKVLLEHPGLLVLDEGHTPRNSQSLIWKAISEIRTKRRIILSGTPFQNNFDELYNTLCLARPKFGEWNPSGYKVVFDEKRGHPRNESRGKWGYLTNSFGKVSDDSRRYKILKEIRNMISPFVHVHRGTILQDSLPGLRKLVVILKPTRLQKELLEDIQKERENLAQGKQGSSNVLKLEYEESITAVHPALFHLSEGKEKFERFRLNPEDGVKTKFLMELIRLSGIMNEKVLVFSQFIEPLNFLTSQLKSHFSWTEGGEVLKMHGKVDIKLRQASIKAFNDPTSKVRVMLASTKACYEGISLVGASRVVLLDVVWNPSVERQAISRAYRLGQKKFVYTYHLITAGTRDEEKCSRQAEKDQLSELVFFNSDGAQHRQNFSSAELEDKILEEMVQQEKFRHIFEKVATKKQTLL